MIELVVASAFGQVLGPRLKAVVAYGSAVTGDVIPGYSDLDLAVFMEGRLSVGDAVVLQRAIGDCDRGEFAYLSLSHCVDVDVAPPIPLFVPGAVRVVTGAELDRRWLHDDASLLAASERLLATLPARIAQRLADWTVAGPGERARQVRLLGMDLKPALRACLVRHREPIVETWAAPYRDLVTRWRRYNPVDAIELEALLGRLPPRPGDERSVGDRMLGLVELLTAEARSLPPRVP
ncbi:MAG: nucleotidyltransferase domain-containing protein [Dehalococcoidia bacterium]|nr:nucleotidyltransferase domain-containing protein [Dehalococcoidia bacterium]